MFERFTWAGPERVLVLAQEKARLLDHNFIGTERIPARASSMRADGVAAQALEGLGHRPRGSAPRR